MSDVDGLVEFLRARLDEDEAEANHAPQGPWFAPAWKPSEVYQFGTGAGPLLRSSQESPARHAARRNPARVLAEVEAKRRIVDGIAEADPHSAYITGTFTAWDVLRLLALPDADHPDYRTGWRP